MSEVVALKKAVSAYQEYVVDFLERQLARAKNGEVLAIVGVEVHPGSEWDAVIIGETDTLRIVGMLETAKRHLLNMSAEEAQG